jgi:hypothetical protein
MFSKKKSLARIASLRSKREPPTEEAKHETIQVLNSPIVDSKRMSWHWEDGALAVPLRKDSSLSTPNLATADNAVLLPPLNHEHQPRGFSNSHSHSLRYSGGALHGMRPPADFDHDFGGEDNRQVRMRKKMLRMKVIRNHLGEKADDNGSLEDSETTSSTSGSPRKMHPPRRTQSVRVPPVVRVTEDQTTAQEQHYQRQHQRLMAPPAMSPPIAIPATSGGTPCGSAGNIRRHVSLSTSGSPGRERQYPYADGESPGSPVQHSSCSDYEDDYGGAAGGDNIAYCTPPMNAEGKRSMNMSLLAPRKDSVSKSRSMTSLASGAAAGDPLNNSISASQARARSFLVGAIGIGPFSLLGTQELDRCLRDRTLRVFVGSWNMNGNTPPRYLADFLLPQNLDYVPDVLVVCTQECFPERTEWEVRLQDTLGPSHVLFHSSALGTLHQAVFLRRDLIWYCSIPETDSFNTRPGAQFRTKGAVAIAFLIFGTSFLFVNSHLTAHQENTRDRLKDLKKINAMLNLPKDLPTRSAKHKDISDKFDCVFWAGDLNFRLEQSREVVIREVRDGSSVLDFDQLNFLRREGLIFRGYRESEITFPPTYKYDVGTKDKYDTSPKQRTPSFTDRILYKHGSSTDVNPIHYDSVFDVTTSDHKPVWGIWEVKLRPGNDSIPLAGGLFNREVYLEGMKRRSEALKPDLRGKQGANANMCNLQ